MGKVVAGFFLGVIVLLAAEYLFLTQGGMPVATKGDPLPLETFLASRALHTAMAKEAKRPAPLQPTAANLAAGAKVYRNQCEGCHGSLDQKQPGPFAKGMFPHPPMLMPPHKGVTDDPVGETWWKVKNGIRLSGMPAFETMLSEDELWQVSLFLQKADELPESVKAALR